MSVTTSVGGVPRTKRQYTLTQLRILSDLRGKVFDEISRGNKSPHVKVVVLDGQPNGDNGGDNNIVLHVTKDAVVRRWLDGEEYKFEESDDSVTITIKNP